MKIHKNIEKTFKAWEKEYKKGFTSYIILFFLSEKDMYGYEIKEKLENFTNTEIQYQESGIYQILKKLKNGKYVKLEVRESEIGPKRKYYIISESGRKLLKAFTNNFIYPISKSIVEMIEMKKIKGGIK